MFKEVAKLVSIDELIPLQRVSLGKQSFVMTSRIGKQCCLITEH
jgi:hypothetical protein